MNTRLFFVALALLAGYLAFGDALAASAVKSPESFLLGVSHGIGNVFAGIASGMGYVLGG